MATRGPGTKQVLTNISRKVAEVRMNVLANLSLDDFIHQLKETYPDTAFTRQEASKLHAAAKEDSANLVHTCSNAKIVATSLKSADGTIFPMFMKMNWTFLHAPPDRPFLCSDYPVAWVDPTVPRGNRIGHGLESQNIEVSFPLGAAIALLGHRDTAPTHLNLNANLVDQFNLRCIERAQVEILGPTRRSVEWGLALRRPQTP